METRWLISAALAAGLAFTGCGEDEGGSSSADTEITDTNTVNASKDTAAKSSELTAIDDTIDANTAQGPITQVGNSIQAWVGQYQAVKAQQQAESAGGGDLPSIPGALTAEQYEQAAQDITYTDGNLNGTLTYSNGMVDVNYAIDLNIGDSADGGKTLDGTFNFDFSGTVQSYNIDYDYDITYTGFATDSAGCAVGGEINVVYDFNVSGGMLDSLPAAAREQVESGVGGNGALKATYGPNCGDVALLGG